MNILWVGQYDTSQLRSWGECSPDAAGVNEEMLERWRSKVDFLFVLFFNYFGRHSTGASSGCGGTGRDWEVSGIRGHGAKE